MFSNESLPISLVKGSAPQGEIFRAVCARLAPALASETARSRVQRLCDWLGVAAEAGIEVRLAEGADEVDLSWCAHGPEQPERWRAALARRWVDVAADEAWQRVRNYLERADWSAIESAWFEFDLRDNCADWPVPGLFLRTRNASEWRVVAEECALMKPATVATVEAQLAIVRDHVQIGYYGFMLSRRQEAMRLVLGASPKRFSDSLRSLGWASDWEHLENLIASLDEADGHLVWQADFGLTVGTKIGVEIFFSGGHAERHEKAARLLARWTGEGLCSTAKAEAVLAWDGTVREKSAGANWPAHLRGTRLEDGEFPFLSTTINHLKLTLAPDGTREAKAYLFFDEQRYRPAELRKENAGSLYTPPLSTK